MLPRFYLLQWSLLFFGSLFAFESRAQLTETFKPVPTYDGNNTRLIEDLQHQFDDEMKRMGRRKTSDIATLYGRNTKYLVGLVRANKIVKDAEMQSFVDTIFNDLKTHTKLNSTPRRVLIAKLSSSNATCMGEGTFLLTTGLLGRVNNESQSAGLYIGPRDRPL
jgi:hypothetical protein